ncbi:MAG: rhodanese-like domain-containing protein [Bacteroidia bacterium]|jgi:rhodanese-related sulfurtransferase|nr:rhodanese-like domain-containing protein [Bacteroidia bacterium]MCO5253218.1 rhodanese-like domain-containing protein [Bacteroidota bacterium]MCZ2128829.1 rhodanese-like domain-containing protein [Bacteroidia bacterium]
MFGIFKSLFGADNAQLKEVIKDGAYLVDVRTPGEFSGGSVKGAVNIPLDTIPGKVSKFKGKKNIVLFCQSGGRCTQAKGYLEQQGITNIYNGGSWYSVDAIVNEIEQEK